MPATMITPRKTQEMPRALLMSVSMLLVQACTMESRPAAPVDASAKPAPAAHALHELPKPPAPPAVIEAIFQDPGDRSASYEVDNGSWATYWFGHSYQVGDKPHYTGFVEQSPDRIGVEPGADDPPSATATLTQATFVHDSVRQRWTFAGAQRSIGEVGGRGRADAVDTARKPVTHGMTSGRMLLAVPTNSAIEQGTVQKNYEVLLRAADGAWSHVGTINVGYDDSAGCDGGRAFPCAPVTGRMTFERDGDGMPSVRVVLSGRSPTARAITYRFDTSSAAYKPANAD